MVRIALCVVAFIILGSLAVYARSIGPAGARARRFRLRHGELERRRRSELTSRRAGAEASARARRRAANPAAD